MKHILTIALLFLFVAFTTAVLGFGFLAASAAGVAHLCLALFAVLFIVSVFKGFPQKWQPSRARQRS